MHILATLPLVLLGFPADGVLTVADGEIGDSGDGGFVFSGGVLLSEDQGGSASRPGLIRYIAPDAPQLLAVALVRDRLRWGTYACRGDQVFHRRPRYTRRPRPLRPADGRRCLTRCPPALFGRLDEAALIPSD